MSRSTASISKSIVVALVAAVTACSGADGISPPPATPKVPGDSTTQPLQTRTFMSLASSDVIVGPPGEAIGYPPSVLLTSGRPGGTPVVGVPVSFTFSDGRGSKYSTVTDPNGKATLANLRIDDAPGQYDITATVEGVGSITFSVRSLSGHVIATYDLVSMDDYSLPVELHDVASNWLVIGGHYQLFDNGTYRSGYQLQGKVRLYDRTGEIEWTGPGMFIRRPSGQIEFYSDPPPTESSGAPAAPKNLLSVGTISGGRMKMSYPVLTQSFDEEYVIGN